MPVIGAGQVAERFRQRVDRPDGVRHLVGWLPGMHGDCLQALARRERIVATPANLDLPAWDRLIRRYLVSSQRHARLLMRAGVALGRIVVVEAGATSVRPRSGVYVSGPADRLDSGGIVAAAAAGAALVLVEPALVPDGASVVAEAEVGREVAKLEADPARMRALGELARAWWARSHQVEHEVEGLLRIYSEARRR